MILEIIVKQQVYQYLLDYVLLVTTVYKDQVLQHQLMELEVIYVLMDLIAFQVQLHLLLVNLDSILTQEEVMPQQIVLRVILVNNVITED